MAVTEQPDVLDRQVEATVVTTNAPAGKPIGWQAEADWQATLNLLKETGGITEVKALNAYFTNEYLQ
jgi:NitT/TauT family transport system substrate-binding protein